MASQEILPAVVLVSVLFAVAILLRGWRTTIRLPFPPGPKPRFLLGNLLDMPHKMPWITYTEWGKQYGDVVHAQVFGQHILILNSIKAATELLEKAHDHLFGQAKHSYDFSHGMGFRFRFYAVLRQMAGGDCFINTSVETLSLPITRFTSEKFETCCVACFPLRTTLPRTQKRDSILFHYGSMILSSSSLGAAIILDTVYGYDLKSTDDRFVHLPEETAERLTENMLPGACIVNTLPFLRHFPSWFPGCSFHEFARDTRDLVVEMKNAPFDFVKQNMQNGSGRPSVLRELLERNDTHSTSGEQEEVMKDVAGVAYVAAVDTTTTTLIVSIMALALNPEVAKKAQNELDAVVGLVFREVFRWRPILPFVVPHATSDDDIYEGYFIPKGTMVLPNVWAMVHDESMYPNPDRFDPERFLNADGQLNADDQILGFGFGRRACVGRYAADATVWATIVSVLSTFDIAKAKDETGKEIEIEPAFSDGATR
ncbi:Cytochrome p450 [Mycena sanguinolenta]|uniref:Cytochrome p450 n=1 Tax=Mycena sanguinolenta TaxID=230812 RepID=A0A8H7CV09_9AGAR|nr:Cytochrome p450 [Mycena sanguinolenta]